MQTPWSIRLVRMLFITLAVLLGAAIAEGFHQPIWVGTLAGGVAGVFFVVVDALLAKFTFRDFSFGVFRFHGGDLLWLAGEPHRHS